MRNFALLILILLSTECLSQSVSYLSYKYTEILSISIKYNYYGNSYQSYEPYVSTGNIMATLQARYDRNSKIISQEWGKLLNLELINVYNKQTLDLHKKEINAGMKNCRDDLSKQYIADQWIEYVTQTFRVPSIKNEIKLLQSCYKELNRIKQNDPDNYIYSKRYKAINKVLNRLESCPTSEINSLSWEAFELMDNENTQINTNNNYNNISSENYNSKREPYKSALSDKGKLGFYSINKEGYIDIYVDGYYIGTLKTYFTSGDPNCGDNGVITVELSVGNHNYKCISGDVSWTGTTYIESGTCHRIKLKKN
jgi:hypothetical protein